MGCLNCHFKFYILPLNQLFHLNKKILFSVMKLQLLQVTLKHVDLLLTIYSFKEKILLEDILHQDLYFLQCDTLH